MSLSVITGLGQCDRVIHVSLTCIDCPGARVQVAADHPEALPLLALSIPCVTAPWVKSPIVCVMTCVYNGPL